MSRIWPTSSASHKAGDSRAKGVRSRRPSVTFDTLEATEPTQQEDPRVNRTGTDASRRQKSITQVILPDVIPGKKRTGARIRRNSSILYALSARDAIRTRLTDPSSISLAAKTALEAYSKQPEKASSLDLRRRELRDSDVEQISLLINVMRNVQKIDLSGNFLTFAEDVVQSKALPRKHCRVKVVSLRQNDLGNRASRQLRAFIQCFVSVEELNLSSCDLRDCDIHGLVLTFLNLRHLRSLNLSANSLSDFAMLGIAKLLADNSSLESVDVSANALSPACWSYLSPYRQKVVCDVPVPCSCNLL